jgi:hypothetical protein
MPSIAEIHYAKTGKVSDKWASYLPFYDALFAPLQNRPINLLEIGVQNGGSLETWATYFDQAQHLVGCDINPRCGLLRFDDPRIKLVVGNANSRAAFDAIHAIAPHYDIIIDDGSHMSPDVIESFLAYFTTLAPGGIYVVEDTHALYWPAYQGGIDAPEGALMLFRLLTDLVNFEFWAPPGGLPARLAAFFPDGVLPRVLSEGWIDAIEFRNSLIVIRKSLKPGHNKLGNRVIMGSERLAAG